VPWVVPPDATAEAVTAAAETNQKREKIGSRSQNARERQEIGRSTEKRWLARVHAYNALWDGVEGFDAALAAIPDGNDGDSTSHVRVSAPRPPAGSFVGALRIGEHAEVKMLPALQSLQLEPEQDGLSFSIVAPLSDWHSIPKKDRPKENKTLAIERGSQALRRSSVAPPGEKYGDKRVSLRLCCFDHSSLLAWVGFLEEAILVSLGLSLIFKIEGSISLYC